MWPAARRTCGGTRDDCQSRDLISLQLEVVSLQPRVFIVENFLNDFEVGTIIDIAKPHISDSIVGSSHLHHHHYYYFY